MSWTKQEQHCVGAVLPYLQEKGISWSQLHLLGGWTYQNVADRLFNTLKRLYRKMNLILHEYAH
jgi:hypothetical protein